MDPNEKNGQETPEKVMGKKQIADAPLQGLKTDEIPVGPGPETETPPAGKPLPQEALDQVPTKPEDNQEFEGKPDNIMPVTGEENAPPMEMTEEVENAILAKQAEDDAKREKNRASTEKYENGKNIWRLISKVYNNNLQWEHTTMAMAVGTRGIIVHVKEAISQKVNATSVYIDNGKLLEKDGKWYIS